MMGAEELLEDTWGSKAVCLPASKMFHYLEISWQNSVDIIQSYSLQMMFRED